MDAPDSLGEGRELRPVPPTCGRAGDFFRLLCEMGYADALDRVTEARKPPPPPADRPASLAEVAGVGVAAGPEPVVQFDLGLVWREIGYHDAYGRLASIVFAVDEAAAADVPLAALRDAWHPFVVACVGPSKDLEAFVLDWA